MKLCSRGWCLPSLSSLQYVGFEDRLKMGKEEGWETYEGYVDRSVGIRTCSCGNWESRASFDRERWCTLVL